MNLISKRFLGVSFIIFAVLGMIISVVGIIGVWRVRTSLLEKIVETSEILDATLSTTYDGMSVLHDTLDETMETLDSTEKVLFAMARTVGDINELSNNFLGLLPIKLPGLGQPDGTAESGENTNQIEIIESEMENIAENFRGINFAMTNAQDVVLDYQEIIDLSREQLDSFRNNFPRWISTTTWILTILLIWFAITQIGFILQGVTFLRSAEEISTIVDKQHQ